MLRQTLQSEMPISTAATSNSIEYLKNVNQLTKKRVHWFYYEFSWESTRQTTHNSTTTPVSTTKLHKPAGCYQKTPMITAGPGLNH